ncbi:RNA-directed DNA polymerase, eukaryota [Tanacetum coccineum]
MFLTPFMMEVPKVKEPKLCRKEETPVSEDPFGIYGLLHKNNNNYSWCMESGLDPKIPPGFTPSYLLIRRNTKEDPVLVSYIVLILPKVGLEKDKKNRRNDIFSKFSFRLLVISIYVPKSFPRNVIYGIIFSLLSVDGMFWVLSLSKSRIGGVGILKALGLFSVKSSRATFDDLLLHQSKMLRTRCARSRILPIKINVFAWKVCLDALPTRCNMSHRGIDIPSILCPLCNRAVE